MHKHHIKIHTVIRGIHKKEGIFIVFAWVPRNILITHRLYIKLKIQTKIHKTQIWKKEYIRKRNTD